MVRQRPRPVPVPLPRSRPDRPARPGPPDRGQGNLDLKPRVGYGGFPRQRDFQGGDLAYFRVGKQFISWGKGLYYSPADVLSLSSIDPADLGAVREGPVSLKASLETGAAGTYQAVISTNGATSGSDVKFSAQGSWLLAGTEISIGGFYQPSGDASPRLFATTAFKLFDLNCYTESLLFWGNDQKRLADDGNGGLVVAANDGSLLTQETIGFSYSKDDAEKRWNLLQDRRFDGLARLLRHGIPLGGLMASKPTAVLGGRLWPTAGIGGGYRSATPGPGEWLQLLSAGGSQGSLKLARG